MQQRILLEVSGKLGLQSQMLEELARKHIGMVGVPVERKLIQSSRI